MCSKLRCVTDKGSLMEFIFPSTMTVTFGAVIAFLTIFASIIGVYYRLSGQVRHLEEKFDKMAQRNDRADQETEEVKREQASQKTAVAVMAEQIHGMGRTLERATGLPKGTEGIGMADARAHEKRRWGHA